MINFEIIEGFQWDEGNIKKNPKKHGIYNIESEQIFFNEPLLIVEDNFHSSHNEKRYSALGITDIGKNLTVIFTIRNNFIRIISSRIMSDRERKIYNENI